MAHREKIILLLLISLALSTCLRFRSDGTFKILQIADMHYANGENSRCVDVLASQAHSCTDLNTTAFMKRLLASEEPDLVVFTGDNIDFDAADAATSMNHAFAPVVDGKVPWAAVLGNHDQESNLPRRKVMEHIAGMSYSLSRLQPESSSFEVSGWGNFHLGVLGPEGTVGENETVLNLYFLDSGDYSKVDVVDGYDWIRASQQLWFQNLSTSIKKLADEVIPALAFFHIPLPEYEDVLRSCRTVGVRQEPVCSASITSGFFSTLVEAGDVKAAFVGHDHVNDYCGELLGVQLCYGGGTGYHGYGKAGWARRARVIVGRLSEGRSVTQVSSWKRLDDAAMSVKDSQVLWDKSNEKTCPLSTGSLPCWFWPSLTSAGMMLLTLVVAWYLLFRKRPSNW